jgi:hypothetical protein
MCRALVVGLLSVGPLLASGCVFVEKHTQDLSGHPSCHPSQYWDGNQCRHKGQGQGARKHDGDGTAAKGKKR